MRSTTQIDMILKYFISFENGACLILLFRIYMREHYKEGLSKIAHDSL